MLHEICLALARIVGTPDNRNASNRSDAIQRLGSQINDVVAATDATDGDCCGGFSQRRSSMNGIADLTYKIRPSAITLPLPFQML